MNNESTMCEKAYKVLRATTLAAGVFSLALNRFREKLPEPPVGESGKAVATATDFGNPAVACSLFSASLGFNAEIMRLEHKRHEALKKS